MEAAGEVIAVGDGVHGLQPGDRVATFGPQRGAYASARIAPAASLFKLPAGIGTDTAAAALLKACTVRSEEHTSELQSLMRISYAVFCLKKKNNTKVKKINIQLTL